MDTDKSRYNMHKLMRLHEIDAFSAQKNAGMNSDYFILLDDFLQLAPSVSAELTAPSTSEEVNDFLRKIHELQKHLLVIGASALLWDAEKVSEAAKAGDSALCGERNSNFIFKVNHLCTKIEEARINDAGDSAMSDTTADTNPVAGDTDLPKTEASRQEFEKLYSLIENFESDVATAMIRELRRFAYGNAIDALLGDIDNDLTHFEHDAAADHAGKLIALVREARPEGEKRVKKKILAVDDVPDILNMVKSVLKDEYAVYGVTNHTSALKFLANNSADLILLDIEMPDMSGFELLGIIRKIKAYETTPVLFLTGSVTVENIVKSRQAGGNDFLKKPIDAQVLLNKIAQHLE